MADIAHTRPRPAATETGVDQDRLAMGAEDERADAEAHEPILADRRPALKRFFRRIREHPARGYSRVPVGHGPQLEGADIILSGNVRHPLLLGSVSRNARHGFGGVPRRIRVLRSAKTLAVLPDRCDAQSAPGAKLNAICEMAERRSIATSGVMSIMPILGTIRRKGTRIGSVICIRIWMIGL